MQSNLHSVALFFLTLDAIYNSFEFHIRHIVFLVILTVLYLLINMSKPLTYIVYSLMVKPIYAPLTWVDLQSYILAVGCVIAVLIIHFLARLAYRKLKLDRLKQKDRQLPNLRESLLEDTKDDHLSFEKF